MAKVFVITGPSGVGKGTLISKLLERVPGLELSVSATTREPREGEVDGRDYHFLAAEEFDRRIEREDFLEFATYSGNRYGTLRSEVRKRLDAGHSVVLEIEVQGARQVRAAMRESIQVFIAPPDPGVLRERLESRGADCGRRDRRQAGGRRAGAGGPGRVRLPGRQRRPGAGRGRSGGDRARRARLTSRLRSRMIEPRVDKLLEHADSHYAAVVVAAKRARQINSYFHNLGEGGFGEYPPPMVETRGDRNYLSMALEELAEGKLKYEYRA